MTLCVVLCTAPDEQTAQTIAKSLVEARLAACVNIVANVQSVYRWENEVTTDNEYQLVIKTTKEREKLAFKMTSEIHPYTVPEWVVINEIGASEEYMRWIESEVDFDQ